MIRLPQLVPGITIWRDLLATRWRLETSDQTYTLTAWDWSQRRQIVRAAVVAGQFQSRAFLQGIFTWLVDPTPPYGWSELAYICLHLLKVPQETPSVSLLQAEILLAKTFGWRPGDLQGQPVSSLDEMVAALAPVKKQHPRQTVDREGWVSIQVVDEDAGLSPSPASDGADIAAGLEQMLASVKVWAGLAVESLPEEESTKPKVVSPEMLASPVPRLATSTSTPLSTDAPEPARPRADAPSTEPLATHQPQPFEDNQTLAPRMNRFNRPVRLLSPDVARHRRPTDWPVPSAAVSRQAPDLLPPKPLQPAERGRDQINDAMQKPGDSGRFVIQDIPTATPSPPRSAWSEPSQNLSKAPVPFSEVPVGGSPFGARQGTDWAPLYGEATERPAMPSYSLTIQKTAELRTSEWSEPMGMGTDAQLSHGFAPVPERVKGERSQIELVAHQQNSWRTESEQLPLPPSISLEEPFGLSIFEEQLADALERAAREAGVDLS